MSPSMEPKCDFCATTLPMIYCEPDLVKLCENCDVYVHSANPLSRRHKRTLICEKCFSQPAVFCCLEDKYSYCQRCHWHCLVFGHSLQSLNLFSGSPSPTDVSRMWSPNLEPSGLVSPFIGSLPLNDPNNAMLENELDGLIASSYSMVPHNITYTQNLSDQTSIFSMESKGCPDLVPKLEEGEEDLCEGLNLENAPLNFDVGDDIIRCSSEEQTEPDHTIPNCLLIDKDNTSVTASNFSIDKAFETTSPGQQDCTSYQSGPFQMNIDTTGLPIPLPPSPVSFGQIHPTMSVTSSNSTGDSSAADYQDYGFILSDTPWESNLEVPRPQARNQYLLRYREKKLKRFFGKQIRYASRKARADTRKRVKGRFVKADDNYDYEPIITVE